MKKRILVLARGVSIAGAEIVTLDVMEALKKNGYILYCIPSGWSGEEFLMRLKKLDIPYTPVKLGWYYLTKILWSLDSFVHYPGAVVKFLKVKKAFKEDIIYVCLFRPIILLYPFIKKNIIYHVHDTNSYNKLTGFLLKKADRKILKYIAVSGFIKNDLVSCGINPGKIEVIHNGVDEELIPEMEESNRPYLTIGIIGQVIPRKGHEDVIEALKLLGDKGISHVVLRIVGKGDAVFEQKLKALIDLYGLNEKVHWAGFKNTKQEIFAGIDIAVVPTRNDEPFALVPLEANSLGKMVIVSDTGGFPEMINDGYNGFIIKGSSPVQLAEKIELLLSDKTLMIRMGANGRTRINEYFTKAIMNKKIVDLMDSI